MLQFAIPLLLAGCLIWERRTTIAQISTSRQPKRFASEGAKEGNWSLLHRAPPEIGIELGRCGCVPAVVFPKSFWSSNASWLIMNVITPELPFTAG